MAFVLPAGVAKAQDQFFSASVEFDSNKIPLQPGSVSSEAIKYLNVPYVWGGEDPKTGFDCSGLTRYVFLKFGIDLPHCAASQAQLGKRIGYEEMLPGDLIFFGSPIHHVGIYLGKGYYIQAPKSHDVVKVSRLSDRNDFACARRIATDTLSK